MPPPPTRARADAEGLSFDEKREVLRRRKDVNKGGQAALPVGARALRARIAADASVERKAERALRPKKRPKANEEYSSVKGCMVWVFMIASCVVYVLPVFPLCALVPRVQGSSGAVSTMQFVWRGHAKTPTTRAGPWPDFALRLE